MAEYGEWIRKGAVLSDVTAKKEYRVSRDFIIEGIKSGKLEYREGSVWGNPYFRLLRKQLEESERYWNDTIETLSKKLMKPVQETVQLQAEAISIRQILTEQIKNMSYQVYKFKQKVKVYEKERL